VREIGDGSVLALLTKDPIDALTVALDARLEAARVVLHPALMDLADLRVDQAGAADSASRLLRQGRAEHGAPRWARLCRSADRSARRRPGRRTRAHRRAHRQGA